MGIETLYINDEKLGRKSYIGTWAEWKRGMEPSFREWYDDYKNELADKLYHREIDPEDAKPVSYDKWVNSIMKKSLRIASQDEIQKYKRLNS